MLFLIGVCHSKERIDRARRGNESASPGTRIENGRRATTTKRNGDPSFRSCGSQHTSLRFLEVCKDAKVEISMGSVGDCYDNAMAESFFATLETELIDRQPGRRFTDRQEAQSMIFDYVEGFYNTQRLHSALNYMSPRDFERVRAQKP